MGYAGAHSGRAGFDKGLCALRLEACEVDLVLAGLLALSVVLRDSPDEGVYLVANAGAWFASAAHVAECAAALADQINDGEKDV